MVEGFTTGCARPTDTWHNKRGNFVGRHDPRSHPTTKLEERWRWNGMDIKLARAGWQGRPAPERASTRKKGGCPGRSPLPRKREKNRERERQLKREVLLGVMVVVFVGRRTSIIGKDRKDRSFQWCFFMMLLLIFGLYFVLCSYFLLYGTSGHLSCNYFCFICSALAWRFFCTTGAFFWLFFGTTGAFFGHYRDWFPSL